MILIQKSRMPASLVEYKQCHNARFDEMDKSVKDDLRKSLFDEQGSICAYCMSRLHWDNSKIEHYHARTPDNELDYHNLLAVCPGNPGDYKNQTCDTHKGNLAISIDPQKIEDINTIYYINGEIHSHTPEFDKDLCQTLNLNSENGFLIHNRRMALKSFTDFLARQCPNDPKSKKAFFERQKKRLLTDQPRLPYVGVILYYIDKKLRSL